MLNEYDVVVHTLVCDAPAKSYIMGVKYHSGYSSCTKCEIERVMLRCVLCFPGEIATLRSDEKFKNYTYYHSYQKSRTILNDIPKLELVTNVPLDPMH